jgi:hypothetical protein
VPGKCPGNYNHLDSYRENFRLFLRGALLLGNFNPANFSSRRILLGRRVSDKWEGAFYDYEPCNLRLTERTKRAGRHFAST